MPISQSPPPCQTIIPTCNTFEPFDFKKTDWSGMCALNLEKHYSMIVFLLNISQLLLRLYVIYALHVPAKHSKKNSVSQFHRGRKILMGKRSIQKKSIKIS